MHPLMDCRVKPGNDSGENEGEGAKPLNMLPAVDVNLGAVHIRTHLRA